MSQLSSTLKRYTESIRYTDAPYGKPGYGTYTPSSYGANLATSFLEKEKLGFKPSPSTSFLTRPGIYGPSSILDFDRGRPLLRPDIIRGSKRAESQTRGTERPLGSGLSGGSGCSYGVTSSSLSYLNACDQGLTLAQKKSNSQSDLARDFSSLRTSDSYRIDPGNLGRSPMLARTRKELCALQGLYQAANRPEYLVDYLENYGRKGSAPQVLTQTPPSRGVPEVLSPTYRPSGRYTLWEKSKGQAPGSSRSSSPGRDTMVSAPWGPRDRLGDSQPVVEKSWVGGRTAVLTGGGWQWRLVEAKTEVILACVLQPCSAPRGGPFPALTGGQQCSWNC